MNFEEIRDIDATIVQDDKDIDSKWKDEDTLKNTPYEYKMDLKQNPLKDSNGNNYMWFEGIGYHYVIPVKDAKPGMIRIFNFGKTTKILEVIPIDENYVTLISEYGKNIIDKINIPADLLIAVDL